MIDYFSYYMIRAAISEAEYLYTKKSMMILWIFGFEELL